MTTPRTYPLITADNTSPKPGAGPAPRYVLDATVLDVPPAELATTLGNGHPFVLDGVVEAGLWHYKQRYGPARLTVRLPWRRDDATEDPS